MHEFEQKARLMCLAECMEVQDHTGIYEIFQVV